MSLERFHPDDPIGNGFVTVYPDGFNRRQELANIILTFLGRRERFRQITADEELIAIVFGTQDHTWKSVEDLRFGPEGNLCLP